jgi:hypothetical protein
MDESELSANGSSLTPLARRIRRRRFLELAAATGTAVFAARALSPIGWARTTARWSDPRTWDGHVPGRRDVAVIDRPVLLDMNARVGGVVIRPGGKLVFDPHRARTLRSRGNVVVKGWLEMRPQSPDIVHEIEFVGIDEDDFEGGGHEVLASDVGLWVMHHGLVRIVGSRKLPWARAMGDIAAGATTVELDRDPVGWRVGDELAITPTSSPVELSEFAAFDQMRVAALAGGTVTLDKAADFDHPAVAVDEDRVLTAEVLNLTRNVRIGGTRAGRAHVFIHSAHPQTLRYAALRHVGPRRSEGTTSAEVLGRYGVHFHHSYNGSRGSVVDGVVVRDCGNHSFVPHTSHGVRFNRCIAYDVQEAPFWWDEGEVTHDTLWDECVAARVTSDNPGGLNKLTGFFLGRGRGNAVRGSVAAGVQGEATASGYMWPPEPMNGVWTFEDCLAHNNLINGIFVWQQNSDGNLVTRFLAYHNGGVGIQHGSVRNTFRYEDIALAGNAAGQLRLHANSGASAGEGLAFVGALLDGRGISDHDIVVSGHNGAASGPVEFIECEFVGFVRAPVLMEEISGTFPGWQDFVRCGVGAGSRDLEGTDFEIERMQTEGFIRVQRQDDSSAYRMDHLGQVTPIDPFADPDTAQQR